jgi:single-stranded DNA-binding protein
VEDDNFVWTFDKSSSGQLIIQPCTIKSSEQTNETVTRKVQILFFGKIAEIAANTGEYLCRALSTYVEGRLKTDERESVSGNKIDTRIGRSGSQLQKMK